MSRSRKDGRRSGGHRGGHVGREVWSARPTHFPMASKDGRGNTDYKADTHQFERRLAASEIDEQLSEADAAARGER